MYYIIRLLLVAVILFVFLFIFHKKKVQFTKIKIVVISVVSIVFFILLNMFPIENAFLRFNTIEDALAYSGFKSSILQVVEEDDCAFIIAGESLNSTSLHTVTKYGEKWGLMDADSENGLYQSNPSQSQYGTSFIGSVIYNKKCNKSFINLSATYIDTSNKNFVIKDKYEKEYKIIDKKQTLNITTVFYYTITDYNIPNAFSIYTSEEAIILRKTLLSVL